MNGITLLFSGLAAGAALGTIIAPSLESRAGSHDHAMGLAPYETLSEDRKNIWPADMPSATLDIDLQPDPASGHNLILSTTHFRMTPEAVNTAAEPGTGHGHLFVNGRNMGRIYANMHHLRDLPSGEVTIHVYLGGNDHKVWMVAGQPLFAERTFTIP